VVTYAPNLKLLEDTLESLAKAVAIAKAAELLTDVEIELIDNGPSKNFLGPLEKFAKTFNARLISGHGNVGYGIGHNLSLLASTADFHLILNPDVLIDEMALVEALKFMSSHPLAVMLGPSFIGADGNLGHLCKRYPNLLDLALRGFAPAKLKKLFDRRLQRYEMRNLPLDLPTLGVHILSGSFMFCRREEVVSVGGFSSAFFVYFEDNDLSHRLASSGGLAFVPQVKVVHFGGDAVRKGWWHIYLFARGAFTFFNRNGWRWW
jgi:GT2 family glycosyltransferase